MKVLVTGATGYIGGRLVQALQERGADLRCMARKPEYLRPRVSETTEVVAGDVFDRASLDEALAGVHTAYYLVHSMSAGKEFEDADRKAARNFGSAAKAAGVSRIVYLGGLGRGDDLSPHLESRQETGRVLAESGVETVEFRASVIIGSESLSYAMVRALVEKLPVMIVPKWVLTRAQPVAVEDVIAYLVAVLDKPPGESRIYEIGGEDATSYLGIMQEYARQRGLKRAFIRVPFITPRLSSLWLGLVTPVYARVGRALLEGVRNETIVTDDRARRDFDIEPRGVKEAIERAQRNEDYRFAQTRWSDALGSAPQRGWAGAKFGTRIVDSRTIQVDAPPDAVFQPVAAIGGDRGWYYWNWTWRLRGLLDKLAGGPGFRRGRPAVLRPGDPLDFWRVEDIVPDRLLRLRAEMKLPGRAWLQFEVEPGEKTTLRQTAIFDPAGLAGQLYWYALYPVHRLIFAGMLKRIAEAAGRPARRSAPR